ncbi:MAG TPA: hypothetical protein VHQ03_01540 [Candidatus Dormibacteraeota bacterium]|nr:hypothetical protein [Candidatus Dormibacteraeota bacterium]
MAGDLSPLTIEANSGHPRLAPPALVVAIAVGLGSVDMPVPSVAEWEWLNWSFPREVHAGDTIYARWTLTQKRPPVGGAPSSIVVWRVDVHSADGALCAEGEVGAKVKRNTRQRVATEPAAATVATGQPRRRRRRSRGNGQAAPQPEAPLPAAAQPAGSSRRRRRRRSSGSGAAREEAPAPEPAPVAPAPVEAPRSKGIGGVLRRLRRS